ncbi:MAG: ABC transporter permease subunit [Actinobacteria bacterium]|nr:MAG: ABC transporter permease subunit [Actinomycetota bacterium]
MDLPLERVPSRGAPDPRHRRRVRRRLGPEHAHGHDQHVLPPLNGFAALFASAVGGLVFVEYIFSYPGAGFTLQQAVLGNDYALAQAILVVLSVCVIAANLLMDLLNLVLDPRLRTG